MMILPFWTARKPVKIGGWYRCRIYAFVKDGQPYIATHYGYYPLLKTGNEFYFTGKVDAASKGEAVATANMFFGLIGYAVAAMGNTEVVSMKLDHQTGAFVPDQGVVVVDQLP